MEMNYFNTERLKDNKTLNTYYSKLQNNTNSINENKLYGTRIEINKNLCDGCMDCIIDCSEFVLKISKRLNSKAVYPVEYKGEGCNGCGVCANICHIDGAIRIYRRIRPA